MLSEAPLPHLVPPAFSPDLERDIGDALAARLGHDGTAEELRAYRQLLWAFATAIDAIANSDSPAATPSTSSLQCPAPPSTRGNQRNPMTGRS